MFLCCMEPFQLAPLLTIDSTWDLNYNRKHTHVGFVDGLTGK